MSKALDPPHTEIVGSRFALCLSEGEKPVTTTSYSVLPLQDSNLSL